MPIKDQHAKPAAINITEALNKASQLLLTERWVAAQKIYLLLTRHHPRLDPAWHGLGVIAHKLEDNKQALQLMAKAISLQPDISLYHRNIGEIFRITGHINRAIEAASNACKLAPLDSEAHYHLALAFADKQQFQQAINSYQKAIALKPEHCMALNNLGSIYSQQGNFENAQNCFKQAINANPRFVDSFYNLSPLKTFSADDPQLALMETIAATADQLPPLLQTRLWFALGKAREDCKDFDRAFEAYAKGNAIHYQLKPFNAARQESHHQQLIAQADPARFNHTGHQDACPVFIVGMPRSGTTLVEQILSSHPQVYGAGEINDLGRATQQAGGGKPGFDLRQLSDHELEHIGQDYVSRLRQLSPDALRISNKMPGNFAYLGLIKLILPKAKIIHVVRDPMDSCFSCYAKLFTNTLEFTYNLEALGHFYVRYHNMMAHWQEVMPAGSILEVRYEDIVANQAEQTRRLINYVGLEWDDSCLDFHNNARAVKTASIAQVRKPIYQSSLARWKNFRDHLGPLEAIVGPLR